MNPLFTLLAPLALILPSTGGGVADADGLALLPAVSPVAAVPGIPDATVDPSEVPASWQVRIEQRVIVRIAPRSPAVRSSLLAEASPSDDSPRLVERKMARCVPVTGIAAVQPDAGDRLLLFMRDRRLVSASLEKACSARDFYSGFYLERSKDGMLCVDRDKLHSRAGASCEIGRMRQLVAAGD